MDIKTCQSAVAIAAKILNAKQLAAFQKALRAQFLQEEIERVELTIAKQSMPVQQYKQLNTTLQVLNQQLASVQ